MITPVPLDALRFTLSLLSGGLITLCLFLLIAQLSNSHAVHDPVPQVWVVDLPDWRASPAPRPEPVKRPEPSRPQSIRPIPPKRIAKAQPRQPPEQRSSKPPDAPKPPPPAPEPAPGASRAKTDTAQLPEPVPFFKLTQAPVFLHKATPVYPETERAQGRDAVVRLKVLIDEQGRVRKVVILESAGGRFDQAAREAILASSFTPARIGPRPVAVWLSLPVRFRLH